jgi:hypothetical protein
VANIIVVRFFGNNGENKIHFRPMYRQGPIMHFLVEGYRYLREGVFVATKSPCGLLARFLALFFLSSFDEATYMGKEATLKGLVQLLLPPSFGSQCS